MGKWLPSISILLGLLAIGCSDRNTQAKTNTQSAAPVPLQVTLTPVSLRAVQRTVDLVGTLEANDQVIVSSELDGQISSTAADLGDRVSLGQVLAKIHDVEYRFAVEHNEASLRQTLAMLGLDKVPPENFNVSHTSVVAKAKAEMDDAQVNQRRMKELLDKQLVSVQESDTAQTRYKTALATYQSSIEQSRALVAEARAKLAHLGTAREKLKDTVIYSPLAGSISRRFVSAGEFVKVGAQLYTIVQDNPLKLRGMIPERFAPEIQQGQPVEATVDSYRDRVFKGKISRISPSSDPTSRSFLIEALIDNPERLIKPGFFAHASVMTHVDPKATAVPQQALVTFAGVTKVFVVENNLVARERVVQTGARVGSNEVEITKGLKPGELVIISGLTRLTDGSPVQVSSPSSPPKAESSPKEDNR